MLTLLFNEWYFNIMINQLNLIDGQIQNSNLFMHMPIFDEIYYLGPGDGKVRKYKAIREGQECIILTLNTIRHDEKELWKAVEDFIKRSVADAVPSVQGIYTFDLLTIDIHKEINSFNHLELTKLIMNTTRRLKPGEARLIKYSSVYGIVQKMGQAHWGKIVFKTSSDVFKDKPEYFDLLIKQLLKGFQFSNDPVILLINDTSVNPIFDLQNELQQTRIKKIMDKQIPNSIDFPPEVYVQDKNGVIELLSGMFIE